jgi:proliferating cell nuclear antigen
MDACVMYEKPDYSEDYVFLIKTIQIGPIRTLMTALKEILLETNITFNKHGISIVNMDKSHTILVQLFLKAENFEEYFCNKDKIIIGVNMLHFFMLINTIDSDDVLSLYIEKKDYNDGVVLFLGMRFENGDIKQCKTFKLRLIEPDVEELEVPNVPFSSIINMPSSDFQKIIRYLSVISAKIEIKSVGSELIFKCNGPFAQGEITRAETDTGMEFIQKQSTSKIIQGEFSLKNLGYFIKCTNLCPQIEIFLENDLPLVVKYNISSLGEIKLCLVPLPASD